VKAVQLPNKDLNITFNYEHSSACAVSITLHNCRRGDTRRQASSTTELHLLLNIQGLTTATVQARRSRMQYRNEVSFSSVCTWPVHYRMETVRVSGTGKETENIQLRSY
jgi:hypothetical protein